MIKTRVGLEKPSSLDLAHLLLNAERMRKLQMDLLSDAASEDLDLWFHKRVALASVILGKRVLRLTEELAEFVESGGLDGCPVSRTLSIFLAVSRCNSGVLGIRHFAPPSRPEKF